MEKTVLLIIDVQAAMFADEEKPYRGHEVLENIRFLLDKARKTGMPIVFVQHNDNEAFKKDTALWQVCTQIAPVAGEARVDKTTRDSFYQTELDSVLRCLNIKTIIFCGMQTEYCVNATCSRAYTLGYNAFLASDGHTTFDSEVLPASMIIAHHNSFLQSSFLQVKTTQELLEMMDI